MFIVKKSANPTPVSYIIRLMKNVLEYLEASARRLPDKTAFADPTDAVTFLELQDQARRIGTALAGICEPRTPVPVYLEKSVHTIRAFMGIVYAGCFYAQMDLRQPPMRLAQILQTLNADVLITDKAHEARVREAGFAGIVLHIEDLLAGEKDPDILAVLRAGALDTDPLYCNFTSGSTGTPKGVLVGHRSVIDFIDCFTTLFDLSEEDIIGNQAPFDFDVSVKDIYSGLKLGCTVQIIPTRAFSFPTELLDLITERNVTVLIWAVSALCMVSQLHGFDYKIPEKIRKVIFSGEVMPIRQLDHWREALPGAEFINVYGPTEITCNCTYYRIDRPFEAGEALPIGRPFPNERVFLLDEEDRLITEPRKTGEICVAGTCLAIGYYRAPEATEKVFTQNPLHSDYPERIYRTGDLAEYNEAGELCFASRRDFQIKHLGHRIEPGEIEAAIEKLPRVERACCLYLDHRIVAFYIGEGDKKSLSRALAQFLPSYMIPNVWIACADFPLTARAKIDRRKLETLYRDHAGTGRQKNENGESHAVS